MPNNDLRARASTSFEKYLDEFIKYGHPCGLPASRLSEDEWAALNAELLPLGVQLAPSTYKDRIYYFFVKHDNLRGRASHNFDKYVNALLNQGVQYALPAVRLSEQEWKQLNIEIAAQGIQLVPRPYKGGIFYFFTKSAVATYDKATKDVAQKLFDLIKEKYPNLSDIAIQNIIQAGNDDDEIYRNLRYKQDGKYTGVSEQEYNNAFEYALQSCNNKQQLIQMSTYNHWDPNEWPTNTEMENTDWKKQGRAVEMHGLQHWTWFRRCNGRTVPHANRRPQFHISLNVNVLDKTLQALDNILIEDGGRHIDCYKFPKPDYFASDVMKRHDPITIYLYDRNPELEQKIVKAMQPFVRSNEGLIDEMLGAGCCISRETSDTDGISVGAKHARELAKLITQYNSRA